MILDACCGALLMYDNMHKNLGDNFVYVDIRVEPEQDYGKIHIYCKAIKAIRPLIKASMTHLPFREHIFDAIVCDPPHLTEGLESFMGKKYGAWSIKEIVKNIRPANDEFKRVMKPNGLLLLKIMAERFGLYEYLLNNYTFFMPITYRSESHLSSEKIGWYVAILKAEPQTVSSPHDTQTLCGQAQTTSEQ